MATIVNARETADAHAAEVCTKKLFAPTVCIPGEVERYALSLSVRPGLFPRVLAYRPIWSTQLNAYYLWFPATLLREKFVPPHLKGIFVNFVSFCWSVVFAIILASGS